MSEKSEKPRLELPQRSDWGLPERPPGGGASVAAIVLLLAILGLEVAAFLRSPDASGPAPESAAPASASSTFPYRDLAARLHRNNLYSAEATVREEQLESLPADDREARARTLVSLATALIKAERYEEAIVRLYQAELVDADPERQTYINSQVKLCLQKLGKHDELAYELGDRTSPGWKPGEAGRGSEAADREVARIGVEVITASELDAMIAKLVDRQLDAIPGLSGPDRQTYRERMLAEFQDPQRRLQQLQQLVAKRVLFREGMERELDRSESVREELDSVREELIARQVVLDEMDERIRVSETDLQSFYRASAARYAEPASAKVRVAVLESEAHAAALIASATSEDAFSKLAREQSIEPTTKSSGGLLPQPVREGAPLPVLGESPELAAAIFATAPGSVTAKPVEVASGWAVAFVADRSPRRSPSFDEVRGRVAQDYMRAKEAEVEQQLIRELFEKHGANVRTEAIIKLPAAGEEPAEGEDDIDTNEKKKQP